MTPLDVTSRGRCLTDLPFRLRRALLACGDDDGLLDRPFDQSGARRLERHPRERRAGRVLDDARDEIRFGLHCSDPAELDAERVLNYRDRCFESCDPVMGPDGAWRAVAGSWGLERSTD